MKTGIVKVAAPLLLGTAAFAQVAPMQSLDPGDQVIETNIASDQRVKDLVQAYQNGYAAAQREIRRVEQPASQPQYVQQPQYSSPLPLPQTQYREYRDEYTYRPPVRRVSTDNSPMAQVNAMMRAMDDGGSPGHQVAEMMRAMNQDGDHW
jgi:hypothetical protein